MWSMWMPHRTFATLALASPSRGTPISSRSLTTKNPRHSVSNSKSEVQKPKPTPSTRSAVIPRRPQPSSATVTPSQEGKSLRPHLDPYELSRRLIALCDRGEVDLAVTTLQSAPRNAQNIKVWNTLIQQCMGAKRYKIAYSVFTDMKRRGFVPNVRTCATLMSGYATIEDWGPFTKQLDNVHSVYGQLKQLLEKPTNHPAVGDPSFTESRSASFGLYVIALYISILGKVGQHQKAFDVFHELDTDGPLAPDSKVYSSLLSVLADRVDSTDGTVAQTVSDVKYVWRRHMRSLDKQPQQDIWPRSIEAMIKVLSRGGPSDHRLMFDILRDFCGLPGPSKGEGKNSPSSNPSSLPASPTPPPPSPKVALNPWILGMVLDGCLTAGYPDLAVHYAQSVMDSSSQQEKNHILFPRHLYKLLRAHTLLAREEEKNLKEKSQKPNASPTSSPGRAENAAVWVEWMMTMMSQSHDANEKGPDKTALLKRVEEGERGFAYTSTSALELCYLYRDVPSALRIARALLEGGVGDGVAAPRRSPSMPAKAWTYLLRLAIDAPARPDEKRHCLELLNAHRSVLGYWGSSTLAATIERWTPSEKRVHITLARCILRLLRNDRDSDDPPSSPPDPGHDGAERIDAAKGGKHETWSDDLRRRAESFLKKTS